MKKVLCVLLASVLIMSCLTGCGGIDKKKLVGAWQCGGYVLDLRADSSTGSLLDNGRWDVVNDDILVLYTSKGYEDKVLCYRIKKVRNNEMVLDGLVDGIVYKRSGIYRRVRYYR